MKKYFSLFKIRLLINLQYRASAFGGLVTQTFWGMMLVFMYEVFYAGSTASGGFTYKELVTFVWLQQAFLAFIYLYDWDYYEFSDMITEGGISYELCRPMNLYPVWYVKLFSKKLSQGLLRFAPVIIVGFIFPEPYKLSLPESPAAFLLFITALILGLCLVTAILMLIYLSVFKTMSPAGSMGIFGIVGEFFSGMTIPVPLMPDWLQTVCFFMPFRWCADFPLRVYSGNIGVSEAVIGIGIQLFWVISAAALGALIMGRVTRLSVVQGG